MWFNAAMIDMKWLVDPFVLALVDPFVLAFEIACIACIVVAIASVVIAVRVNRIAKLLQEKRAARVCASTIQVALPVCCP